MKRRTRPLRRCARTGKVQFRDELEAQFVLAQARSATASATRSETRSYRCPFCRLFHLTSQELRHA